MDLPKYIIKGLLITLFVVLKFSSLWVVKYIKIDARYIDIVANFLVFILAGSLILDISHAVYRRQKKMQTNQYDNLIIGSTNIFYLACSVAMLMAVLAVFGSDFQTLFASISIFAAAIAIISKDYISNIINGMIITFSNELNVDDYIKIGDLKGKVIGMTLSKLILLNDDDDVIYIPNNVAFAGNIINYTKREIRKTSIDFEMSPKEIKSVEQLEEDIIEAISKYHELVAPNSFNLKVMEIKKDVLNFKFQYSLGKPDRELEREIRKKIIRKIASYVSREGIT